MEEKVFLLKNVLHFQVNLIPLKKTRSVVFQNERTGGGKRGEIDGREGIV